MKLRVKNNERRCPLCRDDLGAQPALPCVGCGTDYHRACLQELGGCSTLGCERRGQGASAVGPRPMDLGPELRELSLEALEAHRSFTLLGPQRIKADVLTLRETVFGLGLCFSLFACVGLVGIGFLAGWSQELLLFGALPLIATIVFGALSESTDDHYLIDLEHRRLFYNRRFGGRRTLRPIAGFDQIAGLAVDSQQRNMENGSYYTYRMVIVLRSGQQVPIVEWDRDWRAMNGAARELGPLLGVPVYPGSPANRLRVDGRGDRLRIRVG